MGQYIDIDRSAANSISAASLLRDAGCQNVFNRKFCHQELFDANNSFSQTDVFLACVHFSPGSNSSSPTVWHNHKTVQCSAYTGATAQLPTRLSRVH